MTVLPNWIIAGAPKAGTSSLFRWLVDHPDVSGPSEKETYYFVDPGTHMFAPGRNFHHGGLAGYSKLFESCDPSAKAVIESTPAYLYSETALRELPALRSVPQFIFVLREPVAQIRSLFSYFQQNWNWIPRDMTFAKFVAAVEAGEDRFNGNELAANALRNAWYPEHLARWRSAVGPGRMMVLLFEDLVEDPLMAMRRVSARLGIDAAFYEGYSFEAENQTYFARNGALQDLNVVIRGRLPQGRAYNALRRLYRAINTKKPTTEARDLQVEARLAARYRNMLPELEKDFGLVLTRWKRGLEYSNSEAVSGVESHENFSFPRTSVPSGLAAK